MQLVSEMLTNFKKNFLPANFKQTCLKWNKQLKEVKRQVYP